VLCCGAAAAGRPPLLIGITCSRGAQQQTRRDCGTDMWRTLDRFIDPAPHAMRAVYE